MQPHTPLRYIIFGKCYMIFMELGIEGRNGAISDHSASPREGIKKADKRSYLTISRGFRIFSVILLNWLAFIPVTFLNWADK